MASNISILTYATGYSYEIFERFCGSLRDTGFSGNVYIIVKQTDMNNINKLKEKFDNIYGLLDNITMKFPLNCHRFIIKKQYVDQGIITSDLVLVCDFRDVIFQKNIEQYNYDNNVDLYGFLEGININQDSACNTPWLKRLEEITGELFYDKISENKVICAGTTIGKLHAIKQYLDFMCNMLIKYSMTEALDQGIHNYMLYLNKLPGMNVKLLSNEDNLVNTVGCDIHLLNDKNHIVNRQNEVSFVVHQYDRFGLDLKQRLSSKYNFTL